jgi:hypothetical protein
MASGERKHQRDKQRELFKEPKKLNLNSIGYDIGISNEVIFRNSSSKLKRIKERISWFE